MRVCPGHRRTCCSRRRRAAATRQLPRHPAGGHRPAGQTDLQPVPRPREERRQGPGHLGTHGCGLGGSRRQDRRRRGHVHLRGPGRRDAALRFVAARRPAAEDHHPRRCGHRARHRVDVVPQRPAARVGARDGHPDRHRRRNHRIAGAERRPVPCLPEFVWHAGLFGPTQDRAGTREAVRRAKTPAIPIAAGPGRGDGSHHRDRRHRRHAGGLPRRRGVQRG